ncbi:hypothetical protein [Streptomyces sp. SID13726]|uniref:hypothetical protein n=1 Tax=Streptomyces sp. SID13726 TaxID=2706058 RepID=UPI0013B686A5|nr:hypothetical protein [Streptomyces sp. SID13726]NEB01371.1 hypothetical protein [Streptomyces sp. SID13726]
MTRESAVSEADAGNWRGQLTQAFEILLGRPLPGDEPGAVHAVYFGGNLIHETGFDRDAAWVSPAALSGAEPVLWDMGERPLEFDASGSIFEIVTSHSGVSPEFAADLGTACFARGLLRGGDLAPLLVRHGIDLAGPEWSDAWYLAYPRIPSDGTLFDAMRVALGIGDGPESLVEADVEVSEEWEEALSALPSPELRAHLALYCTDGDDGLMYLGEDRSGGGLLEEEGCSLVANWEEGQSQVEFAVVRLSDLVAGPGMEPAA